jgi:hypothetical protein
MNHIQKVVLTLSMLLSAYHGLHAERRYLNYERIIQVVAKLKALGKDTAKIEMFEKNFKGSYVNSWFLLPREYNKIFALMLEFLDTTDHNKSVNQRDTLLNVLEMVDDELKGLINRYGYRKELVALSHRTSELRIKVMKGPLLVGPMYNAELKRVTQDLLAESLLNEDSGKSIERCIKERIKKKDENDKKSHSLDPDPYEETNRKP